MSSKARRWIYTASSNLTILILVFFFMGALVFNWIFSVECIRLNEILRKPSSYEVEVTRAAEAMINGSRLKEIVARIILFNVAGLLCISVMLRIVFRRPAIPGMVAERATS